MKINLIFFQFIYSQYATCQKTKLIKKKSVNLVCFILSLLKRLSNSRYSDKRVFLNFPCPS